MGILDFINVIICPGFNLNRYYELLTIKRKKWLLIKDVIINHWISALCD